MGNSRDETEMIAFLYAIYLNLGIYKNSSGGSNGRRMSLTHI